MFEQLEMAPADAILGLTEAFKKDQNPNKCNLGVGVYKDADGKTPILESVKRAEKKLLEQESTKSYLPIPGSAEFEAVVQEMVFGVGHEVITGKRAATAHTPGGTGAVRVGADFIKRMYPEKAIWLSKPTWANHPNIFKAAGLEVKEYEYYHAETKSLAFDSMLESLKAIPEGDAILLHGCCHNPSGVDPSLEQWEKIGEVLEQRNLLPLVDFAYQGLGNGIREDAEGCLALCRPGRELLIATSYSKNFGLYRERCGALTVVGASEDAAKKAFSHVKKCIRTNYSNPPSHGGAIVAAVYNDPELRSLWEEELKQMRDRINGMRKLFVETLKAKGVERDFSFISKQLGMFSFSGLTKEQVGVLRDKYSIYIVGSGRINVAGITEDNIDMICQAIADVL